MDLRLTGEEFTYAFKSEITNHQLDGYETLQERMNHTAMKFKGYLGQDLSFTPLKESNGFSSTTRVTLTGLQLGLAWLDSDERCQILNEAEALLDYKYHSLLEPHSFDQWLDSRKATPIPVWKINVLVWLAFYPSVMILILTGGGTLGRLPLLLNLLICNVIIVSIMGWWFVPWLSRLYSGWLKTNTRHLNVIYTSSVLGFCFYGYYFLVPFLMHKRNSSLLFI